MPVVVDTATDLFAINAGDCTLCPDIVDRSKSDEDNDVLGGDSSTLEEESLLSKTTYGKNTLYGSEV